MLRQRKRRGQLARRVLGTVVLGMPTKRRVGRMVRSLLVCVGVLCLYVASVQAICNGRILVAGAAAAGPTVTIRSRSRRG